MGDDEDGPSRALVSLLLPLCSDAWVQCDHCELWRRVPKLVSERLGDDEQWFCKLNNDDRYDNCDRPQEIDNDEIDILLKAQNDAEEQGLAMVPGLKEKTGWNSRKTNKIDVADAKSAGAAAGPNDNVWHRIHRNIFTHREPKSVTEDDVLICNCVPCAESGGLGCGDECINRDVLVECDPNFCPCGSSCQNQKFQSKEYAKLDIKRTGKKGHGLFTKQPLRKGQFIIEYVGEVLHEDEYRARKARYESEEKRHYYFMTLSSSETIDAAERGNAGRFLNHSCDPNCETQKWMVNGELCIGIYALEDIRDAEELTFDYNFERYGDNPIKCFCGTTKCGGWIGGGAKDGEEVVGGGRTDVDDQIGDVDEEEYYEPVPVMLEADETKIALEETKGREARHKQRAGGGSGRPTHLSDAFGNTSKKDNYGNDDDDYDGDGEIALRKKELKREESRAQREASRGTGGARVSSGSGLRRSGSSSVGVGGGARRTGSIGSFGKNRSSGAGGYNSAAYALNTMTRRSEVDVSMELLRGKSGALRNAKAAVKCVHLFNLAYPVLKDGTQSVSQRDLGLLLEAVALTVNPATQQVLIEKGLLQALQMCVQRLGGVEVGESQAPILRKIIKIIDAICVNSPSLVVQRIQDTRTARGSLAQAIGDLRNAKDAGLRTLAVSLVNKLPASAVVATTTAPMSRGPSFGVGSVANLAGAPPLSAGPPPSLNAQTNHPGSVTGSVSSPASSMASNAYGRMGNQSGGNISANEQPSFGTPTIADPSSRRDENGPGPGRSGYTPACGFITPGGVVPGIVSSGGHGLHFNRRGLAGVNTPGGPGGTPMGMGGGDGYAGRMGMGSGNTPGVTDRAFAGMGGAYTPGANDRPPMGMGERGVGMRGAYTPGGTDRATGMGAGYTPGGGADRPSAGPRDAPTPASEFRRHNNAPGHSIQRGSQPTQLPPQTRVGGPQGENQQTHVSQNQQPARPGDWLCQNGCGNVFASKARCFRCGAAKPPDARTFGGHSFSGMSSLNTQHPSSDQRGPQSGSSGPQSAGRKRDRDEFDERRGGWGGLVPRDREETIQGDTRQGQHDTRQVDRRDWHPNGAPNVAPPPGMTRPPAKKEEDSSPKGPPKTAQKWDSPLTQRFHDDVASMMRYAMVPYRNAKHARFMPGANYDRLVAKLTNSVVEKEQTKWREQNAAIPKTELELRLGRYVDSQVKAMHTAHYAGK